jgi:glycosyltransferase involved in cell wall biosynthesis
MKICYLLRSSSLNAERFLRYFAGMGHEIHVLSFEPPGNVIDGVHYHIFPTNKKFLIFSFTYKLIQFRRRINTIRPDLVDAHYVIKYGIMATLLNFHPFVINAVGSDILVQAKKNPIWKIVARYALSKADLVVCRSPAMKEAIIKYGIHENKVRVILDGIDTGRFHPMPKDARLKEEHRINFPEPVVISTRSFKPVYNIETLVRAIPLVLAEIPEAKFVITGRGDFGYIEKMARSLNVTESVRFTGWVPHTELPRYLCSSDIYVSTSLSDGTPSSLLEAMACGLPVVVTDIAANKEWINSGKNGFMIPVKDPTALAERIIYLIRNEQERTNFGKINRVIVQERAREETEKGKIEKAYQSLMGKIR